MVAEPARGTCVAAGLGDPAVTTHSRRAATSAGQHRLTSFGHAGQVVVAVARALHTRPEVGAAPRRRPVIGGASHVANHLIRARLDLFRSIPSTCSTPPRGLEQ